MSTRAFDKCKAPVKNRGKAPDEFLNTLIDWACTAPNEIFAPNDTPVEAYTVIKSSLATIIGQDAAGTPIYQWDDLLHRKAALCELMRVHAGFESSWNWHEGVDLTNATSQAHKTGQESGIFQVSFDSQWLNHNFLKPFAISLNIDSPEQFILAMISNRPLALEYYARLVRISITWAGPLLRHGSNSVYPYLSRASMLEFLSFLM